MKNARARLARLLKAAAMAPSDAAEDVPFEVEQSVLARWQAVDRHDDADPLLGVFRWAFVCAFLVISLSLFLNYRSLSQSTPNQFNIADSVIKLSLLP